MKERPSGQPLLPPRLSGRLCVPCTPVSWFSWVCLRKPKDVGCREASNAGSRQGTGSQCPEATSIVYSLRDPYLWTPRRDAPRPRHHSMGSRFATVLRFTENLEKLELKSRAISLKPGPKSTSITGDAVFDPNHPGTHSWASHGFSAWLINPQYLLHLNFSTSQSPESCP